MTSTTSSSSSSDLDQPDDAGVVEGGEDLGLAPDAGAGPGDLVGRPVQGQPLEGDLGPVVVLGQVDDAHAAPAQTADHPVRHAPHPTAARVDPGVPARVGGPSAGGRVGAVTETEDTVIAEALTVIDRSLAQLASRELVSAAEMSDLLLDLRLLLMSTSTPAPEDVLPA